MTWQPIATAPKDGFCLGFDPALKAPFPITWNERKQKFVALEGFGDETPTLWQVLPPIEDWLPVATAPKDDYCLGFDPVLKRPFVMLWNTPDQVFAVPGGTDKEVPLYWLPRPPAPLQSRPGAYAS